MAVPTEQQGVGMGMITLAIGAQAAGMNLLGLVASMTSAREAMVIFSVVGVLFQAVAWLALPQCSRMATAVAPAAVSSSEPALEPDAVHFAPQAT